MPLPTVIPGACLSESAPRAKTALTVAFLAVNMLALQSPALPPGKQQHAECPKPKIQVQCEQQVSRLPLGIQAPPQVRQQSNSAPQRGDARLEQPVNRLVLQAVVNPVAVTLSASAPQAKFAVQVDAYPNTLAQKFPPYFLVDPAGVNAEPLPMIVAQAGYAT